MGHLLSEISFVFAAHMLIFSLVAFLERVHFHLKGGEISWNHFLFWLSSEKLGFQFLLNFLDICMFFSSNSVQNRS